MAQLLFVAATMQHHPKPSRKSADRKTLLSRSSAVLEVEIFHSRSGNENKTARREKNATCIRWAVHRAAVAYVTRLSLAAAAVLLHSCTATPAPPPATQPFERRPAGIHRKCGQTHSNDRQSSFSKVKSGLRKTRALDGKFVQAATSLRVACEFQMSSAFISSIFLGFKLVSISKSF